MVNFAIKITYILTFCIVGTTVQQALAQVPAAPLVWFRADSNVVLKADTVLQWNDVSGHGYDGYPVVPTSRPRWIHSAINGLPSLIFNGAAEWLECGAVFPVHQDYTIVVVLHDHSFAYKQNIIGGVTGHSIEILSDSLPRMYQSGDFATSSVPLSTTKWSILAVTFTTSTRVGTMWIDGREVGSGVSPTDNSDNFLAIGALGGGNSFVGEMSEILIYDRALSTRERESLDSSLALKYGLRVVQAVTSNHGKLNPIAISSIETNEPDRTTIKIQLERASTVQIKLFDALGRTLYVGSPSITSGSATISLNTATFSSGVYFCRVSSEQGEDERKFTLVR